MPARWSSCAAGAWPTRCATRSAPEDFPHTALYCTTLDGLRDRAHRAAAPRRPRRRRTTSPERAQRCNQIWLDPILRDLATSFKSVDLRYRWRFEELTRRRPITSIATVHDLARDERRRIVAHYVIDCSGGHSAIRRQLGMTMSGSPYIGHFLSIFVKAPELWKHHAMGKAALINFVEPEGLWRNLVMLDGRELYRFGVRGKEFYDAPDKVDAERHVQRGRRQAACRTRSSRSVAGSRATSCPTPIATAASSSPAMPPTSIIPPPGLASTPGFGDAVDLGWKLAATLAGWGGRGSARQLRDRAPAGRAPQHRPRRCEPRRATASASRRRRSFRILPRANAHAARWAMPSSASMTRKFITDGLALGYRYDPSPICWNEADAAPACLNRGLSPQRGDRQPRAARLA